MNEPISILELVLNASVVVQLVMAILILASLVSWVLIFQRAFLLQSVRRSAANFEDEFWSGQDLRSIFVDIESSEAEVIGVEHIFQAGFKEFTRSRQQYGNQAERIMQNVQRSMRVALAREEERLEAALPFLATVGSTSPYIGLFGTVWGIMNSFRGLECPIRRVCQWLRRVYQRLSLRPRLDCLRRYPRSSPTTGIQRRLRLL